MNPDQNPPASPPEQDPNQPVAYDAQGRPLYAHPPTAPVTNVDLQHVHFSRASSPEAPEISEELKAKHDDSVRRYPFLNLSESEYVISAVRRHIIGLIIPVIIVTFLIIVTLVVTVFHPLIIESSGGSSADLPSYDAILLIGFLFAALLAIGGYIVVWVYINNKFFLTNESVIQEIQISLFARNEQTVSLANIEDASFQQSGIVQTLFDYGSIRLSTEGDETTYRFNYVSNPKHQIAILNNAVEAFKNGRPVDPNEEQ